MVIDFGIIGYGWVARDYMLPALTAHPRARLRAVVSPDAEHFHGLPEGVRTYASAEVMAAAEELDAVYVASPNHLHREHVELALTEGWHVLCEKPLAADIRDARRLVAAVGLRPDLVYRTAYDQRHHAAHTQVQRLIQEGAVGNVTQVRIDYACWLDAGWTADNWRIDAARAGGGAVIDLAPHGLDLVECLTGQRLEDLTVYLQHETHNYGVDDGGVLAGRLFGGILLVHTVGYNRPEKLPRRRLEIIGTEGSLLAINTMGQTAGGILIHIDAETGDRQEIDFSRTSPFADQLQAFIHAIHHPTTTGHRNADDDLRLAELLDAALVRASQPTPNPTY